MKLSYQEIFRESHGHDLTLLPSLKFRPLKEVYMKVTEMKNELEKVSRVIPELRNELDKVYHMDTGKKSKLKLLWKEYEEKVKEMRSSREYRDILQ